MALPNNVAKEMNFFLGDNIRFLRKQLGMTHDQFAESIGYNRSAISNWEIDQSMPMVKDLCVIAKYFGQDITELLFTDMKNAKNKDITGNLSGNLLGNLSSKTDKVSDKETDKVLNPNEISELENRIKILEVELSAARKELSTKDEYIESLKEQITLYKRLQATISSK